MKLSEAIRLGSMIGPQAYGVERRERRTGFLGLFGPKVTESCAYGAAKLAHHCPVVPSSGGAFVTIRGARTSKSKTALQVPFQWWDIISAERWCPVCARIDIGGRVISHLNDDHKWTREQIADWIEQIEQEEERRDVAPNAVPVEV